MEWSGTHNNEIIFGLMLEEVAIVELMDATDPSEHNGDAVTDPQAAGFTSRTIPLDDSTSQANVSIAVSVTGGGELKIDERCREFLVRSIETTSRIRNRTEFYCFVTCLTCNLWIMVLLIFETVIGRYTSEGKHPDFSQIGFRLFEIFRFYKLVLWYFFFWNRHIFSWYTFRCMIIFLCMEITFSLS